MKLVGHLRDAFAVGLGWGLLWVALAMILGTIIGVMDPEDIDPGEEPIVLAPVIGLAGFVCGVVFAVLLFATGRGKSIRDLSFSGITMWGMAVSTVLVLLTGKGVPEVFVAIPIGAFSAIVSVAFMRMWPASPARG